MSEQVELAIPQQVLQADRAIEILRVWIVDGTQCVTLAPGVWKDPAAWGIALVDLAQHVANTFEKAHGWNREEALARLREGIEAEWEYPTDEASGDVT